MGSLTVRNLPTPPYRSQMYDKSGAMSSDWQRWFGDLWQRIGSSSGDSIYDALDVAQSTSALEAQLFAIRADLEQGLQGVILQMVEQIREQGLDPSSLISDIPSGTMQQVLDTVPTSFSGGISTPTFVQFNTTSAVSATPGMLTWNDVDGTLSLGLKGGNVTLQLGQEMVMLGYNRTGATIPNGTVVYVLGAHSDDLEVAVASNASYATAQGTIGVTTEDIPNNNAAFFTSNGLIHGLNTNAFNEGDQLWLGVAGALTNVRPTAPTQKVSIGYVVKKHPTAGIIFVKPSPYGVIGDLTDVSAPAPSNGQALTWVSANNRWQPATPTGGTVTSVAASVPSFLTVSGSPITTTGTLAISYSGTALPVLNGGTGVTTSTGTGSNVLSTSPALVTPNIGAASGTQLVTSGVISTSNGNIGAGIVSPVTRLQARVSGTTSATQFRLDNDTDTSYGQVQFVGSTFTTSARRNNLEFITNGSTSDITFLLNGVEKARFGATSGHFLITGATSALGYGTGAGGAVTQVTSRTTGVTLNKSTGAITLVSAAGSTSWQSFTVTNSTVAATDVVLVNQKSGADLYQIFVTAVSAGSFRISFATTGGTTTEQPVFNFVVIKAVSS